MAASMELNKNNLIDDLGSSFLNCITLLTNYEHFNVQDSDETKTSIENAMQRFIELSRETEAFFLKKRMLASYEKPEQLLNEDMMDMKAELATKEQLLKRHSERLKRCQMVLQASGGSGQAIVQSHPSQQSSAIQQHGPHLVTPPPHFGPGTGVGQMSQYPAHPMQQMTPQCLPYQGYPGAVHGPIHGTPMLPHPTGIGSRPHAPPSYPQGPLAYLEQTTSNIGLPDTRR